MKKYECNICWDTPCECLVPSKNFLVKICPNDPDKETKCNWQEVKSDTSDLSDGSDKSPAARTDTDEYKPARDARMPEWYKVGEWVYHIALSQYAKIEKITADGFIAEDGTIFKLCDPDYFKPARFRKFTDEEMYSLVGRKIRAGNNLYLTLTCGPGEDGQIRIFSWGDGPGLTADELLNRKELSIDGHPCGILEVIG